MINRQKWPTLPQVVNEAVSDALTSRPASDASPENSAVTRTSQHAHLVPVPECRVYIKSLEDRVAELELALRNQGIDTESVVSRASQDALESTLETHSSKDLNLLRLLTSSDQGTPVQRFQLCMVLAIAIRLLNRTDSSVPTTASDSFFASAIVILTERPQATWSGDLEHLQNLLLIVQYTIFASNLSAAWHFIGLATRLAIDLDLLNESRLSVVDDAHENEAEVNKRPRVFWSTYILETNLCVILNRPRSIPDEAIFTPLPSTCGPESSSPLVNHCILFRQLEYEIFHTLNYKTPANGSFFDYKTWKTGMKGRLVEWHANVPALDPTSKLAPQNFFDGALHMTLVSLLSPSRHFPHLSEDELRDLAQYASTSIELYREGFKEGKLRFNWRTTPNLFQSGAALIHCIKNLTLLGAVFDVNALKSRVSVCSTVLWGMAERYPPGASYRDRFDEMSATIDEMASELPMDTPGDFLFGHNVLPSLDLDGAATLWMSTPPTLDPWILDQT
ncbi:positive transcriptional regulator for purine utilization [Fusarium napiforme]|uniref:Positive transcriptional regulator for purine utilization n=1 Tax=Fusarium napiforme TaxID=42672 RepID=A0A8H5ISU3_9HYPO|nr:positive transcriptional regulator for purine utilization [Fusarium napiforme]